MKKSDLIVNANEDVAVLPDEPDAIVIEGYNSVLGDVVNLLESSRQNAARTLNSIITSTYWEIGHRIVELEQQGQNRAAYGSKILNQLSGDLQTRFGRGFSYVTHLTQASSLQQRICCV